MRYFFIILSEIFRVLVWLVLGFALAIAMVYAIAHAIDNWDAPIHDYSGFSPDYNTAHIDDLL